MRKPENPVFFILVLGLMCVAFAAIVWWALASFLARYRG